MLKEDDKVEDIATGRQGVIIRVRAEGPSGKLVPYEWHVRFTDGKEQTFRDEKELRKLNNESESGFYPADPLQK